MGQGTLAHPDDALEGIASAARREQRAYSGGEHRPLGSYLALMATYAGSVATTVLVARASGAKLPERPGWGDLALAAIATQRLSRLLSKDSITSPLRAPFTRFSEPGGPSEVNEAPRGSGARKAVGELLACPFCTGQWIATGLMAGLALAPAPTRWVASTFAVVGAADALQFGYAKLQQATE